MRIILTNLSRADASRVVREAYRAALDDATIASFGLDRPLPRELADGQRRAIDEGHCQQLPASIAEGMVRAQVARDVWMAKVVAAEAARGEGVVLLAGNGHVRRDLGVPAYLPRDAAVLSLGVLETKPGETDPRAFARRADGGPAYDVIWFTAPHPRPDPCEAFKKRCGFRPGEASHRLRVTGGRSGPAGQATPS